MSFQVRDAVRGDGEAILALMPRLAAFEVPDSRNPHDLWRSDAAMFQRWLDGEAPQCFVQVAANESKEIIGFTLVSLRPELLSHEPSAHLEAIAVSDKAEGMGVGQALLAAAEAEARSKGAKSMTLHVFAVNSRARGFYEKSGYDGELIRYTKALSDQPA
ncbi:MAG: GNAT family N-acetyltransferase [Woeseiaceae bacterium]|nr:GNAT family N-acetyltransferase [Woeseiaceae bacterium]